MFIRLTCPHCGKEVELVPERRVGVTYQEATPQGVFLLPVRSVRPPPFESGGPHMEILSEGFLEGANEDHGD